MLNKLPNKKIALLSLALPLAFVSASFAQETTGTTGSNVGIQISSPTYSFELNPGETAPQQILKIKNVSDSEKTFYFEVLDFKAADETGTPEFLTGNEETSYTHSLASWVAISKEPIKLKPNESDARSFTIKVPSDAEPGGRYAGILIGTNPNVASGNQVVVTNKVGSLLLVRIKGDTNVVATVKEFSIPKTFFESPPVEFTVRIQNSGNVHIVPKGVIEIKDTFGKKVTSITVNEKSGNVLPDSIRKFLDVGGNPIVWKPSGFLLGHYRATMLVNYGNPAKSLSASLSFWIVPWKLLLAALLGLIVLILLLVLLIRRYNRWILSKAEKSEKNNPPTPPTTNSNPENSAPPAGP